MEVVAHGYPLTKGDYAPIRLPIVGFLAAKMHAAPRMAIGPTEIDWGMISSYVLHNPQVERNSLGGSSVQEAAGAQLDREENHPVIAPTDPAIADKVSQVRAAINALRVLRFVAIGKVNCGAFGFWPDKSSEFLQLVGRMISGQYFNRSADASVAYLAYDYSCHADDYFAPNGPRFMLIMTYPDGSDNDEGMDGLGHAGSWRKLSDWF